jgi:hypothetical protein
MEKETPFPPIKIKGKYLHSPYNPLREAEKNISREDYSKKTCLILFEPGLGYTVELLLKTYPHLRFLIISPLKLLKDELKKDSRIFLWEKEESLENFLSQNIHESDISSLAYLPWPPSVRLLPEEAKRTAEAVGFYLKRLKANHAHVSCFGRTNLRNSFINYLSSPSPRIPLLKGVSVLTVASGPSLAENLSEIKKKSQSYFIIALPSAVSALKAAGVKPQLILSTDPGYWATRHFRHFPCDIPLGMGLNSNADHRCSSPKFPLFNQQTFLDQSLIGDWKLPIVPSMGSVALSALELARVGGASSFTFAGLDLCMKDIKSHVSPHSFDNFLLTQSTLYNSLHQIYFERVSSMTLAKEGLLRYGHALEQYKIWLEQHKYPFPLYRLNSGTPPLNGVKEIEHLSDSEPLSPVWITCSIPPAETRRNKAIELIRFWKKEITTSLGEDDSFNKLDKTPFGDFIYTLIPEEYSQLKNRLLRHKEVKEIREKAEKEIMTQLRKTEELCEQLSLP